MSTAADLTLPSALASRILSEGYGSGAWHGPDLKAALADVKSALAYWRPAPGRHNIAEIALHHAFCARGVRAQLSGVEVEPFVMEGADWFELSDQKTLKWAAILSTVGAEQTRLAKVVADIESGKTQSPLADPERFGLVLGVTCHAIYHAGQIQLIKRLHPE